MVLYLWWTETFYVFLVIDTPISDDNTLDDANSTINEQNQQQKQEDISCSDQVCEKANNPLQPLVTKKIIEIGCVDVPLGVNLCQDNNLHFANHASPRHPSLPIYEVICSDYSDSLIKH